MPNRKISQKSPIQYRPDDNVDEIIRHLISVYPRVRMTEVIDIAVRSFLISTLENCDYAKMDKEVGEYYRGDQEYKIKLLCEKIRSDELKRKEDNEWLARKQAAEKKMEGYKARDKKIRDKKKKGGLLLLVASMGLLYSHFVHFCPTLV